MPCLNDLTPEESDLLCTLLTAHIQGRATALDAALKAGAASQTLRGIVHDIGTASGLLERLEPPPPSHGETLRPPPSSKPPSHA